MSKIEELIKQYCPDGVKLVYLGEMCQTLKKQTLTQGDLVETGRFPVMNSGRNIYGKYNSYNNYGNAITIAARGEYAGYVNFMPDNFWAGGLCYPYRSANENLLKTKFLYYYLKSIEESVIRTTLVSRGGIPALNKFDVDNLQIPLPPLPIQEKIAEILDKFSLLTAELEAELEAELDLQKKRYDYYRNRILSFDSEPSSNSVQWRPLGEIALVTKLAGFEFSEYMRYSDKGNIIALRGLNVKDGHLILNDLKYIDNSDFSKLKRSRLFKGDILFTYVGTVGQVGIVDCDDKFYLAPNVALIRSTDKYYLNPKFLVFYLLSSNFRTAQLGKLTSASSMKNITMEKIRTFLIPIPPLAEQERIVNILDRFEALVTNLSNGLPAEIERVRKQYEYYRNKLLTFPIAEQ